MPNRPTIFRRYALCALVFILLLHSCKTNNNKTQPNAIEDSASPEIKGLKYLDDGKIDEAQAAFEKGEKTNPGDILNYVDLSLIYLGKRRFGDVEKEIQAGLKIQPRNTDLMQILASSFIMRNNKAAARDELARILKVDNKNMPALYILSSLAKDESDNATRKVYLLKILDVDPANIAVRLQLADMLAQENKADSSLFYMQSIKKTAPEFSPVVAAPYKKAVALLQSNQAAKADYYILQFQKAIEISRLYASNTAEIGALQLPVGSAAFDDSKFSRGDYKGDPVSLKNMKFTDISNLLGIRLPPSMNTSRSVLAIADDDGTGSMCIYTSFSNPGSSSTHYLIRRENERFSDITSAAGIDFNAEEFDAAFVDIDNDGYQDLIVATDKGLILYKNRGDGTFSRIQGDIGLGNITDGNKLLIADFDQDGDLDIYVGCKSTNRFFRNNGDGTFTEQAGVMGLGLTTGTKDMDFGDWDGDGDLDIALLSMDGSVRLFNNDRHSKFSDITDSVALRNPAYKGNAIAFGDYNNDGKPDLFVGGIKGGNSFLLKNTGDHGFVTDPASAIFSSSLADVAISDVKFIDFDNDGHEDILVTGTSTDGKSKGVQLFHNDTTKGFSNVSYLLPGTVTQGLHAAIADFDLDGDDDIFMAGAGSLYPLRNDGDNFNFNRYMQVQLRGLSYGNNKNNRLAIGAQIELKAGDLYQLKTVRRAVTNFGVGVRDSLDAVRIVWPNGTPQYIADPSFRQRFVEEEKLKASCPFLFAWNGKKYEFVKDMMWRSVLGMTLAIHGTDTTYAFSDPSKEYLLIPGEALQPKGNKYSIKITEELWEAVYFDKAALVAVDHPDSIDVFADERFVAPPFPGKKVYGVADKHYPVTAVDGQGNDVLDKIKAYDFQYISNFDPGKFQGLAEDHDLVLDLGSGAAGSDSLYLFLRGWTFPSDASISMSMAQSDAYRQRPPSLQVMNSNGHWQTVIPNIGFPMGKDKMVIVNLSGKFLTPKDRRVRIQTNMQIYWDEIFFSAGLSKAPVRMHDLAMTSARLGYRGYSAMYRKGGAFGPHWFDYYNTTHGQKWRDLTGYYTRYGNVLPLLRQADDEYIIANSGDELSIDFDAGGLPVLPRGWKRDFLIYSEGWVKDGDLNTAYGQTVAPLPFHAMPSYPYGYDVTYPSDARHQQYQKQYNTRLITTDDFKNALNAKR